VQQQKGSSMTTPTPTEASTGSLRGAPRSRGGTAQLVTAVRALLLFTLVLGLAYPWAVAAVGRVGFADQAAGSLIERDGQVVGSGLVGQSFGTEPSYFWSRPSAAGEGYDPQATGASNLAMDSAELATAVEERRAAVAAADGTDPGEVAPDALLASASGLDPHISPQYADQQVARVAAARGLDQARVRDLVAAHTQERSLGILGEPRVTVLELNLALDDLARGGASE
jgi:K+-transporting ATPase ATPase C chain